MTARSAERVKQFRPRPMQHTGVKQQQAADSGPLPLAALTAMGVVYGDLGTSPLYTMQSLVQAAGGKLSADAALGGLSLIFWTLLLTVSVKYCVFVMRADNHGEGGILALMSLVGANQWKRGAYLGAAMGLLGAALIYGDGVITPSISVLSAVEGVNVATSAFRPYVLPIAVAILLGLFAVQRFGTAKIGRAFGPIMLTWFVAIALMGIGGIARHPAVLVAVNPGYGLQFLVHNGGRAALILGAVFLCATGGEALYADMGHVGRLPIRLAWYAVVLPALLLCYAGQTAMLMDGKAHGGNPFFLIAPHWALYPLVGLATLATIIASQAIISGSFSMTRQAIQLGWLPMFHIRQTSRHAYGQIYVGTVNWLMAGATLAITLAFRSSDKLAGAYGTAVSTTMLLTSLLLYRAMTGVWRWPLWAAVPVIGLFLVVDVGFAGSNLVKLQEGGWIPLVLGLAIFTVMITWRSGIQRVRRSLTDNGKSVDTFLRDLAGSGAPRPAGTAVFLTRVADQAPPLMIDYVRATGSLHETVIVLSVHSEEVPRVDDDRRTAFRELAPKFWRVDAHYGFMEDLDLSDVLGGLPKEAAVDLSEAIFFGTRDFVVAAEPPGMARWRITLFAYLFRNGMRITDRFNLPPDRTLEIARQIAI